ncbi:hypothetical protein RAC89_18960 [Paenibacillus sp. GD4]|uniref:hypothetical protein n=1 Tax=Paenibacillus sp. GD4 TaxID=3068890 RepID=UPI002796B8AC|nr:hypothetical protein [Paenibacillus sp. GD4]MDQ1912476.1 hypothetical protein [Paenibacillus sp. GD4]
MSDKDHVLLKRSAVKKGKRDGGMPMPSEEDLISSRLLHPGDDDREPVRLLIVTSGFGRTGGSNRGKNVNICSMAA